MVTQVELEDRTLEEDHDYTVFSLMGEFGLRFEEASRLSRKHGRDIEEMQRATQLLRAALLL